MSRCEEPDERNLAAIEMREVDAGAEDVGGRGISGARPRRRAAPRSRSRGSRIATSTAISMRVERRVVLGIEEARIGCGEVDRLAAALERAPGRDRARRRRRTAAAARRSPAAAAAWRGRDAGRPARSPAHGRGRCPGRSRRRPCRAGAAPLRPRPRSRVGTRPGHRRRRVEDQRLERGRSASARRSAGRRAPRHGRRGSARAPRARPQRMHRRRGRSACVALRLRRQAGEQLGADRARMRECRRRSLGSRRSAPPPRLPLRNCRAASPRGQHRLGRRCRRQSWPFVRGALRSTLRPPVDDPLRLALRALDRPRRHDAHRRRHADMRLDQMLGAPLAAVGRSASSSRAVSGRVSTSTSSSSSRSGRVTSST